MKTERYEHHHLDVACELEAAEMGTRADEWRQLRENAGLGTEPINNGARLRLRPDAWNGASDLARREAACCGFLDFELSADDNGLRLDVTSPTQDAHEVIACLVGLQPDCVLDCC
jgi:hypothetical protein